MSVKVKLSGGSYDDQPKLINQSTYRAVVLNVFAFVILGFLTIIGEFRNIINDHGVDQHKIELFFYLFPVWIVGFHFAFRVMSMRRPSLRDSVWFLVKISASIFIIFYVFSGKGYSLIQSIVGVASLLFLSLACFVTFGYLNGYYGKVFAIVNLAILFMQIFHNNYVDHFLWFNLLGLVDVDSMFYQTIIVFISFVLGYSDHTFSLLEKLKN